jgi:formyltetrahydrofolate synthetase
LDNHLYHGNQAGIDLHSITWKRVVDLSDRSLRDIVIGLGGKANGIPRQSGFDITTASEIMALLCLATSRTDLEERLSRVIVAYTKAKSPVTAATLQAVGAMSVLLKDALKPNLVQTLEGTPALVHGGPFGNIAHGCNSVLATHLVDKLSEAVPRFRPIYPLDISIRAKIDSVCRSVYGADGVDFSPTARAQIKDLEAGGFDRIPICVAKTQYSLSDNPKALGRPEGFRVHVRELKVSAGAGFIVVYAGNILTMPGLPHTPSAVKMRLDADGTVQGIT